MKELLELRLIFGNRLIVSQPKVTSESLFGYYKSQKNLYI